MHKQPVETEKHDLTEDIINKRGSSKHAYKATVTMKKYTSRAFTSILSISFYSQQRVVTAGCVTIKQVTDTECRALKTEQQCNEYVQCWWGPDLTTAGEPILCRIEGLPCESHTLSQEFCGNYKDCTWEGGNENQLRNSDDTAESNSDVGEFGSSVLVAPGYKSVKRSEDTPPFHGRGVEGGTGGNAYFTSESVYDPCDDYKGVKFPYVTLPKYGSKLLGFYVVSDCQVVHCTKSRSRNTATACSNDGCVSTAGSSSSGSTIIYDLIPEDGQNAEFPGAATGDICKCLNMDVGFRFWNVNDDDTCYVSQTVVSLSGGYFSGCLIDDLSGLGTPRSVGGCTGVTATVSASGAVRPVSLILSAVMVSVCVFIIGWSMALVEP